MILNKSILTILLSTFLLTASPLKAQEFSVARVWNEMVLLAIRNDFARPTVHARNLFHTSVAMYDAFAVYDDVNETYFLGKELNGFTAEFNGIPPAEDITADREEAMSYAVYRIIEHRFSKSPLNENIFYNINLIFSAQGYDRTFTDTDYSDGNPAALGNYIALKIIEYGLYENVNEEIDYASNQYEPINPPLNPFLPWYDPDVETSNLPLVDPNRWQPLDIPGFTDQAGNIVEGGSLPFLSPEWGEAFPFALTEADSEILSRDSTEWLVYNDPGAPFYIEEDLEEYIDGFTMVAHWKSHTLRDTNVIWDISPASMGNSNFIPDKDELYEYYNFYEGGDYSEGYDLNPITNQPYEPQFVPRSDFAAVVAEFWADGPQSETPPGHWFTILNYVNDNPLLIKKFKIMIKNTILLLK